MRRIAFFLVFLFPFLLNAQKLTRADKVLIQNLENHIKFLASDELEGRRAGSPGEQKAVDYIILQYQNAGIKAMGSSGFIQSFPIDEGKKLSPNSFIKVNKQVLLLDADFFPISNSGTGNIKSMASLSLNEAKQIWFKDLGEVLEENTSNPHFDINEWLLTTAKETKQKAGAALFLYNSGTLVDNIQYYKFDTAKALPIPVLYITKNGFSKYFTDELSTYEIEASIEFEHASRTAHNVAAFIDNKAANTVILGAHLDHLGYNEDRNALDINNNIRNGADDNASGTAALIELAFLLSKSKSKQFNYLFIAFSAEELGLNGSKYFSENPTISLNTVNYMINMDMVGRMNDSTKTITVGGYGTSPSWQSMIAAVKKKSFTIKFDSSGTGPSDHTSFYRKDIPVLFFFTGLHTDYHKPSDDAAKINYVGELQVLKYVYSVVEAVNKKGKIALKVRDRGDRG